MRLSHSFSLRSIAVLLVSLVASVTFAQGKDESKTPVLTRAQFDELLAEPEQLLSIVLRRPDELTAIAGRAGRAGDLLAARGFNVVGRVGVQNYEQEGGKLTKIAPKAPTGQQKNAQAAARH